MNQHKLSKILERKRFQRGAIQFNFSEEVFEFDKNHRLIGIDKSHQSSAMKIIEQFMLEANEIVAKHCVKKNIPSTFKHRIAFKFYRILEINDKAFQIKKFSANFNKCNLAHWKSFLQVI